MRILNAFLLPTVFICSCAFADSTTNELYASLEEQKQQLPTKVRGSLYLTDIVIEPSTKLVSRYYDHTSVDFGRLTARQAKGVSRRYMGELLEQCYTHQSLIYAENMSFEYHIRDGMGRLMVLASVNQDQCDAFNAYHH